MTEAEQYAQAAWDMSQGFLNAIQAASKETDAVSLAEKAARRFEWRVVCTGTIERHKDD